MEGQTEQYQRHGIIGATLGGSQHQQQQETLCIVNWNNVTSCRAYRDGEGSGSDAPTRLEVRFTNGASETITGQRAVQDFLGQLQNLGWQAPQVAASGAGRQRA